MTDAIHIKFWGVRGSTPCANSENMVFGGNTTCLQIDSELLEELLVIDCGTGFRNLGNELVEESNQIRGRVFITHPHWDHLQGFPFFKPFYEQESWFRVYLPPQVNVGCKEILQGHMSNTFFPVTIDMLDADMDCETFYQNKIHFHGYSIEYMWARHTVKTAIYKVEIAGNVIVFAPDNEIPLDDGESSKEFIAEFKSFVKGADVLIHDAQFNMEQHRERIGWGHSDWETVLKETKGLGIRKLYLTHHDPDSTDEYLSQLNDRINSEYASKFEEVCIVKEGYTVSLPSKS